MKRILIAFCLLAAAPAIAEQQQPFMPQMAVKYLMVAYPDRTYAREFFVLLPGGCLTGPMVFFDKDHNEIFKLEAGAQYGDCKQGARP